MHSEKKNKHIVYVYIGCIKCYESMKMTYNYILNDIGSIPENIYKRNKYDII